MRQHCCRGLASETEVTPEGLGRNRKFTRRARKISDKHFCYTDELSGAVMTDGGGKQKNPDRQENR